MLFVCLRRVESVNAIKGTLRNGHVILDGPTNLPDGCRVLVEPEVTEEEQSEDPESIARWLAEFDAIPPLQFTPEEEAQWQADRQAVKSYTLAKMKQRPAGE